MKDTSGIEPRSSYLAVVGDFCRWKDKVVLACDVTAKSEFLNTRRAKGKIAGPGQSQSNIRFIDPTQLDEFGPAIGRGAVWLGVSPIPARFSRVLSLVIEARQAGTHRPGVTAGNRRGAMRNGQWNVFWSRLERPGGALGSARLAA